MEDTLRHYVVKKLPLRENQAVDELSAILEAQDANALGLDVIWVRTFQEIPEVIRMVATKRNF